MIIPTLAMVTEPIPQHVTVAILADGRPSISVLAPAGLACLLFIYEAVRVDRRSPVFRTY